MNPSKCFKILSSTHINAEALHTLVTSIKCHIFFITSFFPHLLLMTCELFPGPETFQLEQEVLLSVEHWLWEAAKWFLRCLVIKHWAPYHKRWRLSYIHFLYIEDFWALMLFSTVKEVTNWAVLLLLETFVLRLSTWAWRWRHVLLIQLDDCRMEI